MWYWILAVASAAVLLYKILHDVKGELSEGAGLPAAAGVAAGFAVCILASSFGPDSFSLSVFGIHISLLALGLTAAVASLLSGNIRNLPMLASGIVTAASIALTYAGYIRTLRRRAAAFGNRMPRCNSIRNGKLRGYRYFKNERKHLSDAVYGRHDVSAMRRDRRHRHRMHGLPRHPECGRRGIVRNS